VRLIRRATSSVPDALVLDASALVEALIGTEVGGLVRARMQGRSLQAPAHLDAEALSALGRLHRAGALPEQTVIGCLEDLASAPIARHPVADLLNGAWLARDRFRLVDGLYVELSRSLGAPLLTTDGRLARAYEHAEMIEA
jgi:predicted nucleic acid-binding protein